MTFSYPNNFSYPDAFENREVHRWSDKQGSTVAKLDNQPGRAISHIASLTASS